MGWFSDIMDNWFGIDPAPNAPPMPSILSTSPTSQATARMPNLGDGLAGEAARAALLNRSGRASTILTTRKKRSTDALPSGGFDSFAGQPR